MTPTVLDAPPPVRSRKRPAEAPAAQPAAPREASGLPRFAALAIPIAAAAGFFAIVEDLPLDVHEHAFVASPESLPLIARALVAWRGADPVLWRVVGAVAIAFGGIGAALLSSRFARAPIAAATLGGVVATHVVVLGGAVAVDGALRIIGAALLVTACAVSMRSLRRAALAALLVVAAWQIAPGLPDLPSWRVGATLILNRRPESSFASMVAAAACVAIIAASFVPALRKRVPAPVTLAAALAWAAMGAGSFLRDLSEETPRRTEAARFLSRLDAVPPLRGATPCEIVLDAPARRDDLAGARPLRHSTLALADATRAGTLRLLRWAPPQEEGPMSRQPAEIHAVLEGTIDSAIQLLAPSAESRLHARAAADEPDFRFSFDGPEPEVSHVRVIIVSETDGRSRVLDRDLEDAIVQRSTESGRTTFAWRPSWRPMACAERELRWEDGDVGVRGRSFWWTVAVTGVSETRIAPFRRVFVED